MSAKLMKRHPLVTEPEVGKFDPSQLITPPRTRVQLKIKEEEGLPEISMITSAKPKATKPWNGFQWTTLLNMALQLLTR